MIMYGDFSEIVDSQLVHHEDNSTLVSLAISALQPIDHIVVPFSPFKGHITLVGQDRMLKYALLALFVVPLPIHFYLDEDHKPLFPSKSLSEFALPTLANVFLSHSPNMVCFTAAMHPHLYGATKQ